MSAQRCRRRRRTTPITATTPSMTVATLKLIDQGLNVDHVKIVAGGGASYCLDKTVNGKIAHVSRGSVTVHSGTVQEAGVCA